jgi:hypothetical protein
MLVRDNYNDRVSRNIGHLTFEEQESLRHSKVAVLGIGGLGGPIADQLIRLGCQEIVICDRDVYDETNLNRQLCTQEDLGKYKVDHLKNHLLQIDSQIEVDTFTSVNHKTIDEILRNVKVVCLSLDDPIASVLIARHCREHAIPMVESWGIPYLWAWWFTPESIDYESCYNMDTELLSNEELENSGLQSYAELLPKLTQFPGFQEIYDRQKGYYTKMINGEIPYRSFAPFVHLTASYLTLEIIFAGLLEIREKVLAPTIIGYDYLRRKPILFQIK